MEPKELISAGAQLGKYEIVHRIAFGGMAEIYLARAAGIQGFEKYVVLKRILPQYAANREFVRMFLREARLAAALDHANIAHVYDIGEQEGIYFFTMEYLHGEDVRWMMRKLTSRDERLPLEHALEIVIRAASGLHFAHDRKNADGRSLGIVHRDVSPSNIVVTYDGGVKVVDFGVAKMTTDPELSRRHSLKGKLAYMSPEQINGTDVDRRGDVFALGIVLYEITTHTRLFKATTEVGTMRMVLDQPITPPSERLPDYPLELERIVMRALEKDPAQRYQTARDLQLDLEAFGHAHNRGVSSAALGDWMERTFGPKQELWHRMPPQVKPGPSSSGVSGSSSAPDPAATRIVSRPDVRQARQPAVADGRATADGGDVDGSIDVQLSKAEMSRPRGRRGRLLAAISAAALLLAAVGGAAILRARGANRTSVAASAPPPAAVLLYAERGNVAVEKAGGAEPVVPEVPAAAAPAASPPPLLPGARAAPTTAPAARRVRQASAPAAGHRASERDTFSATFARREGDIRRCFTELPDRANGAGEISLRFQTGRDGHVTSVAVLPAAVAATPLGGCLAKVASQTVFAPQAEPVTFRIPLTVQLQAGPKSQR